MDKILENPTIVEYIALTKTIEYECWSNESGRGQGNIPTGYKITG